VAVGALKDGPGVGDVHAHGAPDLLDDVGLDNLIVEVGHDEA
jgi:hypothetical protein